MSFLALVKKEVDSIESAKLMWARIVKAYLDNTIDIEAAFELGCYLKDNYGEDVVEIC